MTIAKAFRAMAFQVVISALFGVFFIMVTQVRGISIFPVFLLFFASLSALLDVAFLSRKRTMRAVFIFNGIMSVLFAVAVFVLFPDAEILIRLMALPVAVFFSAYSVRLASDDVSYRTFLRLLDLSIVILLIVAVCSRIRSYPAEMTYMAATATAVSLLSVLMLRHGGTGARGWMTTLLLIAALILLVLLLAGYAPAAGESVMGLWNLVGSFFYSIYDFINWLFGLLPGGEAKPGQNLIPSVTDDPYRKHEPLTAALPDKVFELALLAVLTASAVVLLVYWIRHVNIACRGIGGEKRKVFAVSAARGILMGLSSLVLMVRTKVFIFINRGNSIGLYFWLCSALRRNDLGKKRSETPREFLYRLASYIPEHDFEMLADDVELVFYSDAKAIPAEVSDAAAIRGRLRRLAVSQRTEAMKKSLKKRLLRR